MKDAPNSPRKTARQIAFDEALAVKAQEEFQAKRRLEEAKTRKQLEAKRKRDEALLEDFELQPPPKEIKVVRKTVLIRGRTKRQASVAEPKNDTVILDAAEALASLNMGAVPVDEGGCDDSDAMSTSRESEELNNAKKFEESSVESDATSSGDDNTSWDSNDKIASAIAKQRASKSVKPKSFAARNRAALAEKEKNKCKKASDSKKEDGNDSDEEYIPQNKTENLPDEDPACSGGSKKDDNESDPEYNPNGKEEEEHEDEDPTNNGSTKNDDSDDDLVVDTDNEEDDGGLEMEDTAVNEDDDYPMADPNTVLLHMTKESALEKAIRAAENIAGEADDLLAAGICSEKDDIWCGGLNDEERNEYLNATMKERELILDDMEALKQYATYYRHPELKMRFPGTPPVYSDPLLEARCYFERASAPQPTTPAITFTIHHWGDDDDDDDATVYNPSDSEDKKQPAQGGTKNAPIDIWDDSDGDDEKKPKAKKAAAKEKKPKKKGRGNRKRPTGTRPTTVLQQGDANIRKKLDALQKPMEVLQTMTIPLTRSDETTAEYEAASPDEKEWPWVIHGCFCYTEQKPNEDGQRAAAGTLSMPELHFWTGSNQAAHHLNDEITSETEIKIITHSDYETYKRAFRSSSGLAKLPPPVGGKKSSIDFLKFA